MNRPEMIYLIVNVATIAILLINIVRCWHKGFLLSLWECFGTIFALIVSWNFSSVLAEMFSIYPWEWTPMADTPLGVLFHANLNRFAWIILLYVLIKLVLLILKPLIKLIGSIPLIKQLNELLGGIFGIIITWLWTLLAVIILSVPVIQYGDQIVSNTLLHPIKTISLEFMDEVQSVIEENEILVRILAGDALSEQDKEILQQWLIEYQLDESSLKEYFNFE